MNKGQGPGGPSGLLDSLMGILSGNTGDIDGVLKGIGFAGLMKELPRVMNAAMDWKSSEQPDQQPGDMATPEDAGGPPSPMGPGGGPPPGVAGPGAPGANPMQMLMALAAARAQAGAPMGGAPMGGAPGPMGPAGPPSPPSGPGGMPPLAQLLMRRRMG